MTSPVIEIRNLRKTYRTPFRQRKIDAVRDITLSVDSGEIFGFLGPNGAGKTTTIRMLMGLIKPTGGSMSIFGHEVPSREARKRLGFLPESPYFYDYLNVEELLDLAGRLFGVSRSVRRRRTDELIERVGLTHARRMPMKKFSKGMLQRAGLAQSLMSDPDLVVYDEPMSGLDPIGRKDVRDLIQSLRDSGKTIFFSSHILADVEMICDRVAIVIKGEVHDTGTIRELVKGSLRVTEVVLHTSDDFSDEQRQTLVEPTASYREREGELFVTLGSDVNVDQYLCKAIDLGTTVVSVTPRHETLEDVFIRSTQAQAGEASES